MQSTNEQYLAEKLDLCLLRRCCVINSIRVYSIDSRGPLTEMSLLSKDTAHCPVFLTQQFKQQWTHTLRFSACSAQADARAAKILQTPGPTTFRALLHLRLQANPCHWQTH